MFIKHHKRRFCDAHRSRRLFHTSCFRVIMYGHYFNNMFLLLMWSWLLLNTCLLKLLDFKY